MSRAWVGRWVAWVLLACFHRSTAELTYVINEEWVTVHPPEYTGAINNPLKGFRDYKPHAYGLLKRLYIPWNKLEVCATDSVERIIAYTNQKTIQDGQPFENLNIKLIPRVFLDWNGRPGEQHWPADLHLRLRQPGISPTLVYTRSQTRRSLGPRPEDLRNPNGIDRPLRRTPFPLPHSRPTTDARRGISNRVQT